jgi:hypothetical protein
VEPLAAQAVVIPENGKSFVHKVLDMRAAGELGKHLHLEGHAPRQVLASLVHVACTANLDMPKILGD